MLLKILLDAGNSAQTNVKQEMIRRSRRLFISGHLDCI